VGRCKCLNVKLNEHVTGNSFVCEEIEKNFKEKKYLNSQLNLFYASLLIGRWNKFI